VVEPKDINELLSPVGAKRGGEIIVSKTNWVRMASRFIGAY